MEPMTVQSAPEAGLAAGKCKAIIFDLWGTLVDELSYPESNRLTYLRKNDEIADLLGVDREGFSKAWAAGAAGRMAGVPASLETALTDACVNLGVVPHMGRIRTGVELRYEYVREALSPRPGAIDTISTLSKFGYKVGLISNCGEEVTRLWNSTPFAPLFDAAVFSFSAKLVKPDPRIYRMAAEALGVAPVECLYVGDGSGNELTGAADVGMTPVLIRASYDQADGARQSWGGMRISTIREVLGLLEG